jgi:hypothetical protein
MDIFARICHDRRPHSTASIDPFLLWPAAVSRVDGTSVTDWSAAPSGTRQIGPIKSGPVSRDTPIRFGRPPDQKKIKASKVTGSMNRPTSIVAITAGPKCNQWPTCSPPPVRSVTNNFSRRRPNGQHETPQHKVNKVAICLHRIRKKRRDTAFGASAWPPLHGARRPLHRPRRRRECAGLRGY